MSRNFQASACVQGCSHASAPSRVGKIKKRFLNHSSFSCTFSHVSSNCLYFLPHFGPEGPTPLLLSFCLKFIKNNKQQKQKQKQKQGKTKNKKQKNKNKKKFCTIVLRYVCWSKYVVLRIIASFLKILMPFPYCFFFCIILQTSNELPLYKI